MLGELVERFPSSTVLGDTHEVRRGRDGVLFCTCPRWRYQEGRPPHRRTNCKHIRAVLGRVDRAKREALQARQVEMFSEAQARGGAKR